VAAADQTALRAFPKNAEMRGIVMAAHRHFTEDDITVERIAIC
jgi:hypothetical protein